MDIWPSRESIREWLDVNDSFRRDILATLKASGRRERPRARTRPAQPGSRRRPCRAQRLQRRDLGVARQDRARRAQRHRHRGEPRRQRRRPRPIASPPVPHRGIGHTRPRRDPARRRAGRHAGQRRPDHPHRVEAPGQHERRQQRMTHVGPAARALRSPHPHPPGDVPVAHATLIARPEAHRPPARPTRPARRRHLPARRGVALDRQRARPYDGHGATTPPWTRPGVRTHEGGSIAFPDPRILSDRHDSVPDHHCRQAPGVVTQTCP
ncbi:hypothetical protein BH20ACT8_BH20ACT8_05710 [soil metagenome]